MLKVYGRHYYLDFDSIIEQCKLNDSSDGVTEINVFKFDLIKICVDRLLNEYDEESEGGGLSSFTPTEASPSFNISFNTLIKHDILIDDNE
jgi:hypothetical protein